MTSSMLGALGESRGRPDYNVSRHAHTQCVCAWTALVVVVAEGAAVADDAKNKPGH